MPLLEYDKMVPEVYVQQSRDFQVLTRLFTLALNTSKFNADSLQFINSPRYVNNELLALMQEKVGFYTDNHYQDNAMRKLCEVFYSIVRHKGSMNAIIETIRLYFQILHTDTYAYIDILTNDEAYAFTVRIGVNSSIRDISLLEDILRYIIPTGFKVEIFFYESSEWKQYIGNRYDKVILININDNEKSALFPAFYQVSNVNNFTLYKDLRENIDSVWLQHNNIWTEQEIGTDVTITDGVLTSVNFSDGDTLRVKYTNNGSYLRNAVDTISVYKQMDSTAGE